MQCNKNAKEHITVTIKIYKVIYIQIATLLLEFV